MLPTSVEVFESAVDIVPVTDCLRENDWRLSSEVVYIPPVSECSPFCSESNKLGKD